MITRNQLSMADIFSDCREISDLDKPHFLDLLENQIDLDKIVPASFRQHSRAPAYPHSQEAHCIASLS